MGASIADRRNERTMFGGLTEIGVEAMSRRCVRLSLSSALCRWLPVPQIPADRCRRYSSPCRRNPDRRLPPSPGSALHFPNRVPRWSARQRRWSPGRRSRQRFALSTLMRSPARIAPVCEQSWDPPTRYADNRPARSGSTGSLDVQWNSTCSRSSPRLSSPSSATRFFRPLSRTRSARHA